MQKDLYMHMFACFIDIQYIYFLKPNNWYVMNILIFMQRFPDEASCIAYLKEQREQSGIVCKHCGCKEHIWNPSKQTFECKHCHIPPRWNWTKVSFPSNISNIQLSAKPDG